MHDCYTNSLGLANEHHVKTIAFPNISTGIYHFPKEEAATIALHATQHFVHKEAFEKILFVCFDEENYRIYEKLLSS